jgi:glycosyltransferase involved in cell wall biosynthesis
MPIVSVLIGAYNNAGTLERAARSILAQTVTDLELLVVDDGSTDDTSRVADAIASADNRVRVLRMQGNVGISRSLNAGLRAASAPVVAVLDADDWSEPARLERQLDVLDRLPEVAVVGCRMREVDPSGRELAPRTKLADGEVNHLLMRFNPVPNTAAAFRRAAALEAGGYDPRYRWAAEYDLWLRIAERGNTVFALEEVLATRVMSTHNVASRREREQTLETIVMRLSAMKRRRSLRGIGGITPAMLSYVTPLALKRARRRRLGQAP